MSNIIKTKQELARAIDDIYREHGYGDRANTYRAFTAGFNHRGAGNPVLNNKDHQGYTFFTRPCLNLTYSNLSKVRRFHLYRDAPEMSVLRMARVYLDPWNQHASTLQDSQGERRLGDFRTVANEPSQSDWIGGDKNVTTPLVDKNSPFINILSNSLLQLSGWPDPIMDYYTSEAGRMGEQTIMAQGNYDRLGAFELQGTFSNKEGNPLPILMDLWIPYMTHVLTGKMSPYLDKLLVREYDYNTRIYRFIMDPTKQFITMWAATGASFPTNNALGNIFNYDSERVLSDGTSSLTYSFYSTGATYNDMIVLDEFNRLTSMFNRDLTILKNNLGGDLTDKQGNNVIRGRNSYTKLKQHEMMLFNNSVRMYPLVQLHSQELEWWVHNDQYREIMNKA